MNEVVDRVVSVTEKALKEIRRLKTADPEAQSSVLRIKVVGGGCSGMSYKLGFDAMPPTQEDKLLKFDDVMLVVDSKSALFLEGTELDFSDGLNGKGFLFNNPKAKRTCGCGSSFSA